MTAPTVQVYWLRPASARLDSQRRALVRPSVRKIQPSWRVSKEERKAA